MGKILCLSLLPSFIINWSINIILVSGHCLDHEQTLLLQLKNNLIFDPTKSNKLIHWNQSDDCCHWNGVACFKEHVIALDLSQEAISGDIGNLSSLFNLQYLQSLNLAYNEFHSGIHSEFRKLKNLRYLNLSNAGFEGQIPTEISYLTKLETLDLSCTFTSPHALKLEKPNIAMLLQNFKEIKELYLDGIAISANGEEWSHALSSLQVLSMSSCNISSPLDSSLTSSVLESLGNLSSLTTLQLSSCGLKAVFLKSIFQIPSLQVLDVSNNLDLHGSLPNFPQQGSLQSLNLSHTNFSGPIPESIHNLRWLSTLDLSNCHFNGTIPNSVSYLTQLVHLDLSFNNFVGPLPSFNRSRGLKVLSLNHNDFNSTVPSSHFEGLLNLKSIELGDNSFVGRVPSSLFGLKSLEILMLYYNKFDGMLDEFPNPSMSLLKMVDLSGNNFEGHIPLSIFQLKGLRLLQLSKNKFNGTIKLDMIGRLQNLSTLDLAHNNLLVDANIRDDQVSLSFPNLNVFG